MEAGARLQQRGHLPAHDRAPLGRLGDARQDLQQRALAGAVAPDDAQHLAALHLEGDVLKSPKELRIGDCGVRIVGIADWAAGEIRNSRSAIRNSASCRGAAAPCRCGTFC